MSQTREQKARWQRGKRLRRRTAGQCLFCTAPRMPTHPYCEAHLIRRRTSERVRKQRKYGYQPWTPGGKGRPPIGARA